MTYSKSTDDVVLKFSTWGSASEISILAPIIKDFENSHKGVKVEVLHIPQDYFQKLHLLFASNMEPDVVLINNPGSLSDVAQRNNIFECSKRR